MSVYTTQGLMTAQDVAEIRADMDLDLCGCCGSGDGPPDLDEDDNCTDCGCEDGAHIH